MPLAPLILTPIKPYVNVIVVVQAAYEQSVSPAAIYPAGGRREAVISPLQQERPNKYLRISTCSLLFQIEVAPPAVSSHN
jgi:hypothetical protein